MTRSARLAAASFLATLMLPVVPLPAQAATEVVAAPLPAPTGLAPTSSTVRKDVFLRWDTVSGATGYRVQVGRDDTWPDTPLISTDTTVNAAILPVGSLPYASYTYRVAALKGSALGHWTSETTNSQNAIQFTKGWRSRPTLLTPAEGSTVAFPDFSWTNVGEASEYTVLVSETPIDTTSATDVVPAGSFSCVTSRTRLTPFGEGEGACPMALKPSTTYYWVVGPADKGVSGKEKALSSLVGRFSTDNTLPAVAAAVAPTPTATATSSASPSPSPSPTATAAPVVPPPTTRPTLTSLSSDPDRLCKQESSADKVECTDVPTLRWNRVPGVTKYRLVMSPDSFFQNVTNVVTTQGTSWTSTVSWADMSPTMSMYYDVQSCNEGGCTPVNFASPPSFRKVSPALTGLSTPSNTGLAIFSWQSYAAALAAAQSPSAGQVSTASQDAMSYHLQVAATDDPTFGSPVMDRVVDGTVPPTPDEFPGTTNPTWFSSTSSIGDGSFLWRVQAVDSKGNKLAWSASQPFTRDATPPSLISVSPSSRVGAKSPLKLTFSEAVTGISSSSVTISPPSPATVSVTGPTTATLTPTRALLPGGTYSISVGSAVKDAKGNEALAAGPSFTVNPLADDTNSAISYSSGWRPFSATNAIGGRYYRATPTASYRPTASLTFKGAGIGFYTCLGPANGNVDIYIDNVLRARKGTYRSYSGCGIKIYALALARGTHTIKIVAAGSKSTSSKGTNVAVDAFNVTP